MFNFLRKIKAYFQTVEIYYNKTTSKPQLDEKYKIKIYKSFDQVKDKKYWNILNILKARSKDLKKNNTLLR